MVLTGSQYVSNMNHDTAEKARVSIGFLSLNCLLQINILNNPAGNLLDQCNVNECDVIPEVEA